MNHLPPICCFSSALTRYNENDSGWEVWELTSLSFWLASFHTSRKPLTIEQMRGTKVYPSLSLSQVIPVIRIFSLSTRWIFANSINGTEIARFEILVITAWWSKSNTHHAVIVLPGTILGTDFFTPDAVLRAMGTGVLAMDADGVTMGVRSVVNSIAVDEPPDQIHSYTLLFSLFLHFPYIADPPPHTSTPTWPCSRSHDNRTHSIRPISLIWWTYDLQFTCIYFYS